MEYLGILAASDLAWDEFYESLSRSGFSDDEIEEFMRQMNRKDCFNGVFDCLMESVR